MSTHEKIIANSRTQEITFIFFHKWRVFLALNCFTFGNLFLSRQPQRSVDFLFSSLVYIPNLFIPSCNLGFAVVLAREAAKARTVVWNPDECFSALVTSLSLASWFPHQKEKKNFFGRGNKRSEWCIAVEFRKK